MLDVTTSIVSFVIEVVSTHSALLDSHVILHAALYLVCIGPLGRNSVKTPFTLCTATNSHFELPFSCRGLSPRTNITIVLLHQLPLVTLSVSRQERSARIS